LLPRALGRVQGEQVEEVGDAGHQGEQGGEEGDEENKEDGGSPDREQAGLGGCSRVVVPAAGDQNKTNPARGERQETRVEGPVKAWVSLARLKGTLPDGKP